MWNCEHLLKCLTLILENRNMDVHLTEVEVYLRALLRSDTLVGCLLDFKETREAVRFLETITQALTDNGYTVIRKELVSYLNGFYDKN